MPQPGTIAFDPTIDGGYGENMPPMLDQFLDYDWATNFDFTNNWADQGPNPGVMGPPPPEGMAAGYPPANMS